MRQIPADELDHAIRFEVKQLGKMTLKDLQSHGTTRDAAVDLVTRRILHRMRAWEILVPDIAGNLFETVAIKSGEAPGDEKGPT